MDCAVKSRVLMETFVIRMIVFPFLERLGLVSA